MIELNEVDFSYAHQKVIKQATLSIEEGEFVGIFGPNGGGKTTFLKLLMGFLKPDSGKISLWGKTPEKARSLIGYVPQVAQLDQKFPISALDVVLMGKLGHLNRWGSFTKEAKNEARAALEKVNLLDQQDAPFGTLSGGQQQRVLIARAIVSHPKLLLLDEPTASVDPEAEVDILKLLETLQSKMTILMVTHDLQTIVNRVKKLLCVHKKVKLYEPKEVCEHFALGLYHSPLMDIDHDHF